ncbi:Lrp/AsnC family transcriptional regulator [Exiguobacterium sp. s191]|uniref:Lrp/AsnC family transcriptional regulator n=1 Tax=Exiguobacterium sp. s191 TaxID=2751196 RepID=UPI001BE822AC|nr:Lrp/AsnC family transcriptional regulator [Exiguobacterium sp. s191]
MDQIDQQIIRILQDDARIPWSELGRQIGLSAPAVIERVRKMEDSGIIEGFRAVINPEALAQGLLAVVMFEETRCAGLIEFCKGHPEVVECHRLTGSYNFMVKLQTASVTTLEHFLDDASVYGKPSTWIRLSTPVPFTGYTV